MKSKIRWLFFCVSLLTCGSAYSRDTSLMLGPFETRMVKSSPSLTNGVISRCSLSVSAGNESLTDGTGEALIFTFFIHAEVHDGKGVYALAVNATKIELKDGVSSAPDVEFKPSDIYLVDSAFESNLADKLRSGDFNDRYRYSLYGSSSTAPMINDAFKSGRLTIGLVGIDKGSDTVVELDLKHTAIGPSAGEEFQRWVSCIGNLKPV